VREKGLIIAIDGPAGAGKSTIARAIAERLGYLYLNTGAMYRAVAWRAIASGIALHDEAQVGALAARSRVELSGPANALRVLIDGSDVTDQLARPQVSQAASIVSAYPAVRRALVARQQEMGRAGGVVMEGRDIGTQVFPEAEVKIFLDASSEARAARRHQEEAERGINTGSLAETASEIRERDERDRTRAASPLVPAADAVHIDTSSLGVEEVIERVLECVRERGRE
jgi:cytidylate kinase